MNGRMTALAIFFIVYAVYYATSFSSVTGGDSGELLAEACQLGTAHPPGYPLFTMLSHVLAFIPIPRIVINIQSATWEFDKLASVAWRINHFCCVLGIDLKYYILISVLGALTATFIWCSGRQITRLFSRSRSGTLSTIGAFAYAFTPLVWEYSTTAEVFALNNFLCAVLIYLCCITFTLLARYVNREDEMLKSSVYFVSGLGGLFCGLALSNQHSSVLLVAILVPTILIAVGIYAHALLFPVFLYSAIWFLLGFSSYFYLPWAANQPTPGSWGDLSSIPGFLRHILRAEYGSFRLGMIIGSETGLERVWIYLKHTSKESEHLIFSILLLSLMFSISSYYWMHRKTITPTQLSKKINNTRQVKNKNMQVSKNLNKLKNDTTTHNNKVVDLSLSSTKITTEKEKEIQNKFGYITIQSITAMWCFYVIIWHCILSNLPLSSPMPFAVHSRFWMQPNILLYILMCVSLDSLWEYMVIICKITIESTVLRGILEWSVVCIYISILLQARYTSMNKSTTGNVMHSYGSAVLESIMPTITSTSSNKKPLQALLLSHTDLNWNPVRYLQHCEGLGLAEEHLFTKSPLRGFASIPSLSSINSNITTTIVTHLSFQLMPYPWFPKSQAKLYPHIKFPDMNFPGVSTDRNTEGNTQLILRFLYTNNLHNTSYYIYNNTTILTKKSIFTSGIYIDMQSISEIEIESMGHWRGLTLVPWGPVYRIFNSLNIIEIQNLHIYSLKQLYNLQKHFPNINNIYLLNFTYGSWEHTVMNVYYDAHYQFGLYILTFCIELQQSSTNQFNNIPILLDRYYISASILWNTLQNVRKYGSFSSSLADLTKNTALAWMRLTILLEVAHKFRSDISKIISTHSEVLLDRLAVDKLLTDRGITDVRTTAKEVIGTFLEAYPEDRDVRVFAAQYKAL